MPKAKRLLKDVEVLFISLVDKGANKRTIVWKAKGNGSPTVERVIPILKVDDEKRIVYGIVYAPDDVDAHGDMMTAEEIEKMAYRFMKARRTTNVDEQHDYEPDEGYVAESWIVRKGDPLFPDEKDGAWAVGIKVENEETWEKVKSGDITGLSMGGYGKAEELEEPEEPLPTEKQSIWEKMRQTLTNLFLGGTMLEKDFNEEFKRSSINQAIWALQDALNKILNDESVPDKTPAMKESVNQFLQFLDNLEGDPTMKEDKTQNTDQAPETAEDVQKQSGQPQGSEQNELLNKLNDVLEKISGLEKRLEELEKAHPGRQSDEGSDDDDTDVQKSKGFKGLPII